MNIEKLEDLRQFCIQRNKDRPDAAWTRVILELGDTIQALKNHEDTEKSGRLLPDGYHCKEIDGELVIYCHSNILPPQEVHIFQ